MEPARLYNFSSARRGLTFIESICAIAMLAMVSAAVLGAFNSIIAQQDRQNHRLGAMELANRLILQYLDDSDTMPSAGLPILYGDEKYHWELHEIPVQLVPARPDVAEDRLGASSVSVNRMMAINVTVWLAAESGGSEGFEPTVPSATLTRLMDPIALRNPDTTNYVGQSAVKQRELIERFRTIGRNSTPAKPSSGKISDKGADSPKPSRPAPVRKPARASGGSGGGSPGSLGGSKPDGSKGPRKIQ